MLKLIKAFSVQAFTLLWISTSLFAEENKPVTREAISPTMNATIESDSPALPAWLIQKPFKLSQRVELHLDGSAQAGGIKRSSETLSRLLFVDAGHWRFREELPFSGLDREILRNDQGAFQMTSINRAIAPQKAIPDDEWSRLLRLPHELSQRFGFVPIDASWQDWFEKIKALDAPYENSGGDKIRVSKTTSGSQEKTIVVLEGSMIHQDSTRLLIKVEWTLEQGVALTAEDLKKSLTPGGA